MANIEIQPVIMSGGQGTRLWPASRKAAPKQFRAIGGGDTLFQHTVRRFASEGDIAFAPPVVICNAAHAELIREQLAEIGAEGVRLVFEPVGRNTAPCAALAACLAAEDGAERLVLLAPADHRIENKGAFLDAIRAGAGAARDGRIVTFGARPTGPETGYGYIQQGDPLGGDGAHMVARFVEKPDLATAKTYLASGDYSWNSGIFLFAPETMSAEMAAHCPDILSASLAALDNAAREGDAISLSEPDFAASPSDSIDYAVMEKTSNAAVVAVDMDWNDLGSWSQIWELAEKSGEGCAGADIVSVDAKNCYVHSDGAQVALLGVEDLIVAVQDGAVLVARRDRAQDVKAVIEQLKNRGRGDLL